MVNVSELFPMTSLLRCTCKIATVAIICPNMIRGSSIVSCVTTSTVAHFVPQNPAGWPERVDPANLGVLTLPNLKLRS
jgi:hypothetical protein